MTNKLIIIGLIIVIILGVYFYIEKKSGFSSLQILNTPVETENKSLSQTFAGTMPCADCSGLETKLVLNKNSQYSAEGTYKLTEKYVGKDVTNITKGDWTMIKGTKSNPEAIIYQLMPPKEGGQPINYLMINPNTLELVDQNFNTIDSPFSLNLTLKK